jgi:glycine betaine/choline ABC-type transport system substrate-binding protein
MRPGEKFKATGERRRYTVMAADSRFAIAVKPFAAQKTYLYTITDLERGVRGRCDLIFGLPADLSTTEGAAEALIMLKNGEMGVSSRRNKPLEPEEIEQLKSL